MGICQAWNAWSLWCGIDELRAQHLRRGQLLVDCRHEADAGLAELLAGLPDRLVDHAQRRTAVAADEALRVQPGSGIALALHHQHAHQRLGAGQEHGTLGRPQVVRQLVVGSAHANVDGGRSSHGRNCCAVFRECASQFRYG
jgi:hypothetical protein